MVPLKNFIELKHNPKVSAKIIGIKYPSQNLMEWWRILKAILSLGPMNNLSSMLVIFDNFIEKLVGNLLFMLDHTFGQSIQILIFGIAIRIEIADNNVVSLVD